MKRKIPFLPVLLTCMLVSISFLFSSFQARLAGEEVWKMLGISQKSGTEGIKQSFLNGYLYYYGARNIKNIALNERGAVARDLLDYTRQYISSPEFKTQYEQMRAKAKPTEPILKPLRTKEEIQKDEVARLEKGIKDTEKTLKEVSAEMAKSIQPVLDMQKQMLKEYKDPANPIFASIAESEKYSQESAINSYKENTSRWQKEFPEDLNSFVAGKLQKMLDATKGIDYNAALVEKYGKKRFVNPAYERKGTEWKQGFRAGKDVTETARAFAQKWLNELK